VQLHIADVPRCACNYTQALGLKNLGPPDMAVGSMPPNWANVIHHGTYELLVQRQSVPDGETAAPIQKRTEYPESLGRSSSNLVYVSSPSKSLIKSDLEIFDFFDPLNLVSKKPEWSRCGNTCSREEHGCTLIDINGNPPVSETYFQF